MPGQRSEAGQRAEGRSLASQLCSTLTFTGDMQQASQAGVTQAVADSNLHLPIAMGMGQPSHGAGRRHFYSHPNKRIPLGWGMRKAFWCLPNTSAVLKSLLLPAQSSHKVGRWGGCEDRKPWGNMTLTRRPTPQTQGEAKSSCLLGPALSPGAFAMTMGVTVNSVHLQPPMHCTSGPVATKKCSFQR